MLNFAVLVLAICATALSILIYLNYYTYEGRHWNESQTAH